MTTTSTDTRRVTRPAAPDPHWRDNAACSGANTSDFYDDRIGPTRRARGHCHGCPVVASCLTTTLRSEGLAGYKWGISGGLTASQRRALRCEILLGDTPDLEKALELTSLRWRHVLYPLRYQGAGPSEMAVFLQESFELTVSPATVRLAVWWLGGKAPVRPRRGRHDQRLDWQLVCDECRDVVEKLRSLGAPVADIAAYLDVSKSALETAVRAWNATKAETLEVAA
jgi:hypothetical protein